MGIFDIFKKNKKNENIGATETIKTDIANESVETIKREVMVEEKDIEMDAIDIVFGTIYTDKKDFIINDSLINKISVYNNESYLYFVTHGLSKEHNIEFTYKVNKDLLFGVEKEIECVCANFELIAKLIKEKNQVFDEFQYVYTGKEEGINSSGDSKITGFITIADAIFKNENIKFVEFIGATHSELNAIIDGKISIEELYNKLGTDVTDYNRDSVI